MEHPGDPPFRSDEPVEERPGAFSTTHWSVVLDAYRTDSARAGAALERLCRTYWPAIYAFIRRRGFACHEAEDLTQAFFAHLLETDAFKKADRRKGKFRTFLLGGLTNFLANEWDKAQTLKRGGGRQFLSLEEADAEGSYLKEAVESMTPEKLFERRWAGALVDQVLDRLKQEYLAGGKGDLFAKLEPALTNELEAKALTQVGSELGMNEGAVKVALHRLRRRFGQVLRSEVAHTVSGPEEIDSEIRQLFAAISE